MLLLIFILREGTFYYLDNLCAFTPETHTLVHNESLINKDEYIKSFQDGKEYLTQKIELIYLDFKDFLHTFL